MGVAQTMAGTGSKRPATWRLLALLVFGIGGLLFLTGPGREPEAPTGRRPPDEAEVHVAPHLHSGKFAIAVRVGSTGREDKAPRASRGLAHVEVLTDSASNRAPAFRMVVEPPLGTWAEVPLPRAGTYLVNCRAPGHIGRNESVRVGTDETARLDVALDAFCTVSGIVVDHLGNPTPDIDLELVHGEEASMDLSLLHETDRRRETPRNTASGPEGRFAFYSLMPSGALRLVARRRSQERAHMEIGSLQPGEHLKVEVHLHPPTDLSGRVQMPLVGSEWVGSVALYTVAGGAYSSAGAARVNPDGSFAFRGVAPGMKAAFLTLRDGPRIYLAMATFTAREREQTEIPPFDAEYGDEIFIVVTAENGCHGGATPHEANLTVLLPDDRDGRTYWVGEPVRIPLHTKLSIRVPAAVRSRSLQVVALAMDPARNSPLHSYETARVGLDGLPWDDPVELHLACRKWEPAGEVVVDVVPPPGVAPADFLPSVALVQAGLQAKGNNGSATSGYHELRLCAVPIGVYDCYVLLPSHAAGPIPVNVSNGQVATVRVAVWRTSQPVSVSAKTKDGNPTTCRLQALPDLGFQPTAWPFIHWVDTATDAAGHALVPTLPNRGLYLRHTRSGDVGWNVSFSEWRQFGAGVTSIELECAE